MILRNPDEVNLFPVRYERSTFEIERVTPAPMVRRADLAGALVLIGGLLALGIALIHISIGATTPQAVAWAFIVAGVIATLDRWA